MDEDREDKNDLTSLENIGEFLHEEDETLDTLLEDGTKNKTPENSTSKKGAHTLDEMVDETMSHSIPKEESEETEFKLDEEPPSFDFTSEEGEEGPPPIPEDIATEGDGDVVSDPNGLEFNDDPFNATEETLPEIPTETEQEEIKETLRETVEPIEEKVAPSAPPPPPPPQLDSKLNQEVISIKDFADGLQYGDINLIEGGGPHFSILIKNIKYQEEADEIFEILSSHKLVEGKEEIIKNSLGRGRLIISHISEYSAIYLVHKFRHFDADISMGLTHEITPLSAGDLPNAKGLTYKRTLYQNKSDEMVLNQSDYNIDSIILTTTPTIDGFVVKKYLGIISEHTLIDATEFENEGNFASNPDNSFLEKRYQDLGESLRPKALKLNANAIINLNYQLTPLISTEKKEQDETKYLYKLTCIGSAVYISPQ